MFKNSLQYIKESLKLIRRLRDHQPILKSRILYTMRNPPDLLESFLAKQILEQDTRAIDVDLAALSVLKNSPFSFAKASYQRHWKTFQETFFYIDCAWNGANKEFENLKTGASHCLSFTHMVTSKVKNYMPFVQLDLFNGNTTVRMTQLLYNCDLRLFNNYLASGAMPDLGRAQDIAGTKLAFDIGELSWWIGNAYPCTLYFIDCSIDNLADKFPLILSFSPGKTFASCQGEVSLKSLHINELPNWKPYMSMYESYARTTSVASREPVASFPPIQENNVIVFTRTNLLESRGGIIKLHEQIGDKRFRCTIYSEDREEFANIASMKILYRDCTWSESNNILGFVYNTHHKFGGEIATFKADDT